MKRLRGALIADPCIILATAFFSLVSFAVSFFDNTGRQQVEPSDYTVWVGGDSRATLSAHFTVER